MFPDLTQYLWILWLVVVVVFVIIELLTLEFTFLMLATGSLIGGLGLNLIGAPWFLQIGAAAALAALLLFTIRPLLLRSLHKSADPTPSNVAALIGLPGRVVAPFVDGDGSVKLANGETWTSRLAPVASSAALEIGAPVTVTRILGSIAEVVPAAPVPTTDPERTAE